MKQRVYVLERLTNRKLQHWKPQASAVKRALITKWRKHLLDNGFIRSELRVRVYGPERQGGVER